MTDFDALARFYDLDHDEFDDDIDFYLNLAKRTGSPILELGVGTGRVALPLAKAGFQVTGIDISEAMLAAARKKLDGAVGKRARLVEGDLRHLALDEQYALAISAIGSFMHLLTPAEQLQALEGVHRHLKPQGLLVVDLPRPDTEAWSMAHQELLLEWIKPNPWGEGTIAKLSSYSLELPRQRQHITYFYDEVAPSGALRRTVVSFTLRYTFPFEMELLLHRCGYTLEAVYGSYELEEFGQESSRMIFVARRNS